MGAGGDLGSLRIQLELSAAKLNATLRSTKQKLQGWGSETNSIIQKNSTALTGLGIGFSAVGAAITGLGAISVKTFMDFEQQMKNVQSVSSATDAEFRQMTQHAKQLGETTVFTAREAAEAMYYLGSAGYTASQQMASTAAILDLAAATQSNLAETTQLTVSALKAFQLPADEASRVTNVFAATISSSQATLERLGTSMPYVATTFNLLGYSVEDAAAALGIMYDNGLQASMAGTRLRAMLNQLLDPSKKAAETIEALGLNIEDVNPATHSLVEIVRQFENVGLGAADAAKIFGARAEGMTILVQAGADELERMTEKITGTNRAAEMAQMQLDSLAGDIKLLKSAVEGAAISVGEALAPAVRDLTRFLTKLTAAFNQLSPALKADIAQYGIIAGGLAAIGGTGLILLAQLPKLAAGLKTLGVSAGASGLAGSLGIAGAAFAAFAAVTWAAKRAMDAWNDDTPALRGQIEALRESANRIVPVIEDLRYHFESAALVGKDTGGTLEEMGVSVDFLNKEFGMALRPTMNLQAVLEGLERSVEQDDKKIASLKKRIAGMSDEEEIATETTKSVTDAMTAFDTALKGAIEGVTDAGVAIAGSTGDWDTLSKKFKEWTAITGEGYNATTAQAIAYWEEVRKQGGLSAAAERGVANTIADLWTQHFEEHNRELEASIKETRRIEDQRADIYADNIAIREAFDEKARQSSDKVRQREMQELKDYEELMARHRKAETERIETLNKAIEASFTKRGELRGIERKGAKEALAEQKDDIDTQKEWLADLTGYHEVLLNKELKIIDDFFASQRSSYSNQKAAIDAYYTDLMKVFQKHGEDTLGLQQQWNKDVTSLQGEFFDKSVQGFSDFARAWKGILGDSLGNMVEWVDDQLGLLQDLRDGYNSLLDTINNVSGLLSGLSEGGGLGTGLTSLLGGTLGPWAIGAGVYTYLYDKYEKENEAHAARMEKIHEDSLGKQLQALTDSFDIRINEYKAYGIKTEQVEEEKNEAVLSLFKKHGVSLLDLQATLSVQERNLLQQYGFGVQELTELRHMALLAAEEEYGTTLIRQEEQILAQRQELIKAEFEATRLEFQKRIAAFAQQGLDIKAVTDAANEKYIAILREHNINIRDLGQEQHAGLKDMLETHLYDMGAIEDAAFAESIERLERYGATIEQIEQVRQQKLLEQQLNSLNYRFQQISDGYKNAALDTELIVKLQNDKIIREMESHGIDIQSIVESNSEAAFSVLQQYGIDRVVLEGWIDEQVKRTQLTGLQDSLDALQTEYKKRIAIAEEYGGDLIQLEKWRGDQVKQIIEETGIDIIDKNQLMYAELERTLKAYGVKEAELYQLQYDAAMQAIGQQVEDTADMRAAAEQEALNVLAERQNEELSLLREQERKIIESATQHGDMMLGVLTEAELDRAKLVSDEAIVKLEAERNAKLLQQEKEYNDLAWWQRLDWQDKTEAINAEHSAAVEQIHKETQERRVQILKDAANVLVDIEVDLVDRLLSVVKGYYDQQLPMTEAIGDSWQNVTKGFDELLGKMNSFETQASGMLTSLRALKTATDELSDALAGHSLTTALEETRQAYVDFDGVLKELSLDEHTYAVDELTSRYHSYSTTLVGIAALQNETAASNVLLTASYDELKDTVHEFSRETATSLSQIARSIVSLGDFFEDVETIIKGLWKGFEMVGESVYVLGRRLEDTTKVIERLADAMEQATKQGTSLVFQMPTDMSYEVQIEALTLLQQAVDTMNESYQRWLALLPEVTEYLDQLRDSLDPIAYRINGIGQGMLELQETGDAFIRHLENLSDIIDTDITNSYREMARSLLSIAQSLATVAQSLDTVYKGYNLWMLSIDTYGEAIYSAIAETVDFGDALTQLSTEYSDLVTAGQAYTQHLGIQTDMLDNEVIPSLKRYGKEIGHAGKIFRETAGDTIRAAEKQNAVIIDAAITRDETLLLLKEAHNAAELALVAGLYGSIVNVVAKNATVLADLYKESNTKRLELHEKAALYLKINEVSLLNDLLADLRNYYSEQLKITEDIAESWNPVLAAFGKMGVGFETLQQRMSAFVARANAVIGRLKAMAAAANELWDELAGHSLTTAFDQLNEKVPFFSANISNTIRQLDYMERSSKSLSRGFGFLDNSYSVGVSQTQAQASAAPVVPAAIPPSGRNEYHVHFDGPIYGSEAERQQLAQEMSRQMRRMRLI